MIQMANDQFLVIEIGQPMQQRDRIAPARHADEIARIWRKSSQQTCFCLNPIHSDTASNVQKQ
jgi:hypothetical protein